MCREVFEKVIAAQANKLETKVALFKFIKPFLPVGVSTTEGVFVMEIVHLPNIRKNKKIFIQILKLFTRKS